MIFLFVPQSKHHQLNHLTKTPFHKQAEQRRHLSAGGDDRAGKHQNEFGNRRRENAAFDFRRRASVVGRRGKNFHAGQISGHICRHIASITVIGCIVIIIIVTIIVVIVIIIVIVLDELRGETGVIEIHDVLIIKHDGRA